MVDFNKPKSVIIAGVGGQGAITVAQLVLGAAWKSGYYVLQSEVHGMSQRGGEVNAQIIFDKVPVTSPVVTQGEADLLIGIEPLETLRYLSQMSKDANIIASSEPVINMDNYPKIEIILEKIKSVEGAVLIDTLKAAKELNNKHAGNICILGAASKFLPIDNEVWEAVIRERFESKGEEVVMSNIKAFQYGKKFTEA